MAYAPVTRYEQVGNIKETGHRLVALRLCLEGERALFARPEFRRDLISYDLLTPHAARGVLDAIYWRPGMIWVIDAIRMMQPIRRECFDEGGRRVLILRDVRYMVDAHFELTAGEADASAARHAAMSKRAARSARSAYLGRADLVGAVTLVDRPDPETYVVDTGVAVDHGWLLHGIAFEADRRPRFFRAEAVAGLVQVPRADSALIFS